MDECHHATKKHPYAICMQLYKQHWTQNSIELGDQRTKILGLTASVVSEKCGLDNFFKLTAELESKLWYIRIFYRI